MYSNVLKTLLTHDDPFLATMKLGLCSSFLGFLFLQALVKSTLCTDSLNGICQKLWNEDKNRVDLGKDFRLNTQGRLYDLNSLVDRAYNPLFSFVDRNILNKPTYKTFIRLLDNYERFVGSRETVTTTEREEAWQFLDSISQTQVIRSLHQYLSKKGIVSSSMSSFKHELFKMWFYGYRREAYRDSSGFEHVFVGEIRRGKVTGFHNWLQFYLLEKSKMADYRGYIKFYNFEPVRLKLQLFWGNYLKFVTSMFIGSSPEFEMALYTLCNLVQPGKSCQCDINGQSIKVTTHRFYDTSYKYLIGSAYLNI